MQHISRLGYCDRQFLPLLWLTLLTSKRTRKFVKQMTVRSKATKFSWICSRHQHFSSSGRTLSSKMQKVKSQFHLSLTWVEWCKQVRARSGSTKWIHLLVRSWLGNLGAGAYIKSLHRASECQSHPAIRRRICSLMHCLPSTFQGWTLDLFVFTSFSLKQWWRPPGFCVVLLLPLITPSEMNCHNVIYFVMGHGEGLIICSTMLPDK